MKKFSDFNITVISKAFTGEKIKMVKILNKPIEVVNYEINESKYREKGNGKCLYIQIKLKDELHVVFTGSTSLMEQIQQVPKDEFPFIATIIQETESFKFT